MGGKKAWLLLLAGFLVPGGACKEIEPETGDLRPACQDVDSDPAKEVDFAKDIRPLIDNKTPGTRGCIGCHSSTGGTMEGFRATGLDLSTLQGLRKGSNQPVILPGKPCASVVVQKLQGTYVRARMPKNGPYWDASKIQLMIDWIAEGAQGANE